MTQASNGLAKTENAMEIPVSISDAVCGDTLVQKT
jgi:hypothetical protein